jgi:hypothetical protein
MLRVISETLPTKLSNPAIWSFLIHGHSTQFFERAAAIRQNSRETAAKIEAINCHKTQLKLSRRRFIAYAGRPELFAPHRLTGSSQHVMLNGWRARQQYVLGFPAMSRRWLSRTPNLLVVGSDRSGELQSLCLPIDAQGHVSRMYDGTLSEFVGTVRSEGTLFSGLQISLPANAFALDRGLFVKIERRGIFFDEAGWIDATEPPQAPPAPQAEIEPELSLAVS